MIPKLKFSWGLLILLIVMQPLLIVCVICAFIYFVLDLVFSIFKRKKGSRNSVDVSDQVLENMVNGSEQVGDGPFRVDFRSKVPIIEQYRRAGQKF